MVTPLGTATVKIPAAFAALTPFGESSKAIASSAETPRRSSASRYRVGRGFERSALRSAVTISSKCSARCRRRRWRSTHSREELETIAVLSPCRSASSEVGEDPGPEVLDLEQLELVLPTAGPDGLAVDRPVELLEVVERLEASDRSDDRRPAIERELLAVLPVDLLPRGVRRRLGVDDEAVEVEEERADHSGCLSVGRSCKEFARKDL
jgi:hypothetical protein